LALWKSRSTRQVEAARSADFEARCSAADSASVVAPAPPLALMKVMMRLVQPVGGVHAHQHTRLFRCQLVGNRDQRHGRPQRARLDDAWPAEQRAIAEIEDDDARARVGRRAFEKVARLRNPNVIDRQRIEPRRHLALEIRIRREQRHLLSLGRCNLGVDGVHG
jgi:hypothetical protein